MRILIALAAALMVTGTTAAQAAAPAVPAPDINVANVRAHLTQFQSMPTPTAATALTDVRGTWPRRTG